MKRTSLFPSSLRKIGVVLLCLTGTLSAHAENLFWDANGETVGTGGTGQWNLTDLFWRLGGPEGALQAYTNTVGDMTANFAGTAGTVTVLNGLTVNANALNFGTTNYVIAPGNVSSFLNLDGATPTITTNLTAAQAATINVKISGSAGLTKAGTGILVLGGANTYTGVTTVAGGILRASEGTGLNSQNLLLSGGAYDPNGATAFVRSLGSGLNQVRLVAAGENASTGFASTANTLKTIAIGGTDSPTTLVWGSEYFSPSTGTGSFILNGGTVNTVDIKNSIDLNDTAGAVTRNISGVGAAILSGNLTQSGGGAATLVKTGAGSLTLLGTNTFSGGLTWIDPNTFVLNLGNNDSLGTGKLTVVSSTGSVTIRSTDATARVFTNAIDGTEDNLIFGGAGTGDLTFGDFTAAGVNRLNIQNAQTTLASYTNTSNAEFAKNGAGSLIITGNFSRTGANPLNINAGALAVAGTWTTGVSARLGGAGPPATTGVLGRNGSITAALATAGGVHWLATGAGGGLFAFGSSSTWGAAANNLTVNLGGSGATLTWGQASFVQNDQTLIFGHALSNGTVGFANGINFNGADRTIQVDAGDTNLGGGSDAILSGVLSNGGLIKTGDGKLELTAANTYTGNTVVSAGTLLLAGGGQMSFDIGASGVNNAISGPGSLLLDGVFSFDLSGADPVGSWLIVDVDTLSSVTYGDTFAVVDFTENAPGVWVWDENPNYTFTESLGLLTAVPEPSAAALFLAAGAVLLRRRRR